jgi:SAM-dependent methyltransferase
MSHVTFHEEPKDKQPWYSVAFGEDYMRMYLPNFPSEINEREVDALLTLLDLPRGAKILDLCCGWGRHAIELAKRGYAVTGIDLNDIQLQKARADAAQANVNNIRLIQGDMRLIPFEAEFDAVIHMFNSFGYFDTQEDDQKVLEQVAKSLKPKGAYLQQTANREGFVRTFQPTRVGRLVDNPDVIVAEERDFDFLTSRLHLRSTLFEPDGRRSESNFYCRLYSLTELRIMLSNAGFDLEQYFAKLNGSPITVESVFLFTLSRKR